MDTTRTRIIELYLNGELSEADKIAFEERLKTDSALAAEVKQHQHIHEAAVRASQHAHIKKLGKQYHFAKLMKWGIIGLSAVAIAVLTTVMIASYGTNTETPIADSIIEQLDKQKQLDRLPTEYFSIDAKGEVELTKNGVLLSVPENAFLLNGKPYNGESIIQYQEAQKGGDIVKAGLSTMSGNNLLETQGMFAITGYTPDGELLEINPEVGVYIQVPVDAYVDGMQMYTGEKDANGNVDWIDPVPLEKIPVPIPMSELDFYPEKYEPYLDELKWKQGKEQRDSLYLSFEDYCGSEMLSYSQNDNLSGKVLFDQKCATCHLLYKDATGPALVGVRNSWITDGKSDLLYDFVNNWELAYQKDPNYIREKIIYSVTSMNAFPDISKEQIATIFNYIDQETLDNPIIDTTHFPVSEYAVAGEAMQSFIPPSKVLAFWDNKFNNTNLATHEFEVRMQAIHNTCDNSVLDLYVNNLDKKMVELDQKAVAMGYSDFERFTAENIGKVEANNPHLKGLKDFYKNAVTQLKDQSKFLQKQEAKRQKDWDNNVEQEREDEVTRTATRESEALVQEYNYNLDNINKQLGNTIGMTVRHGGGTLINVDKQVWDATVARETTTITDPFSGKTAVLTYNTFTAEVEKPEQYIKLYAYLFPHEINAYQRIDHSNGKFDYNLNNDILYDLAIVGVKEDGYDYFQKQSFRKGELGTVKMESISEVKLDASIEQLNRKRNANPMSITSELNWIKTERADYKEQKQRQEMLLFRQNVASKISRCLSAFETPSSEVAVFDVAAEH